MQNVSYICRFRGQAVSSSEGSVLQQNVTKLAAIATRSIAVQTEDPPCGGISFGIG